MRTFVVVADDGGPLQLALSDAEDGQSACAAVALLDNLAPGVGLVAYDTGNTLECIWLVTMLVTRLQAGPMRLEPIR